MILNFDQKLDKTRTVLEDSIWIEVPERLQAEDIKEANLREYYELKNLR